MKNLDLKQFDILSKTYHHTEHINSILNGDRPFPLHLEIDLTNACNHRCEFCVWSELLSKDKSTLPFDLVIKVLDNIKDLGTKAITWTGGGEPLLHKRFTDILEHTSKLGIRSGLLTNGSLFLEEKDEQLLSQLEFIRFSIAGTDRESYRNVQGVDDFQKVLYNLKRICSKKRKALIGVATLINDKNFHNLDSYIKMLDLIGCDYIQIRKDYYSNIHDSTWFDTEVIPTSMKCNEKYSINVLGESYSELQTQLSYPSKCYAHYFQGSINATGDFYFCKNTRDNPKFSLGNIFENTPEQIWNDSVNNKELEKYITPMNCMTFCRNMGTNIAVENIKQNKLSIMKKTKNRYFF